MFAHLSGRASFNETSRWVDEVRSERGRDVVVVLVGNKSDSVDEREVTMEEGDAKAREMSVMFLETSAKAGFNIKGLFHKVASALPASCDARSASNAAPALSRGGRSADGKPDVALRSSASKASASSSTGYCCS